MLSGDYPVPVTCIYFQYSVPENDENEISTTHYITDVLKFKPSLSVDKAYVQHIILHWRNVERVYCGWYLYVDKFTSHPSPNKVTDKRGGERANHYAML